MRVFVVEGDTDLPYVRKVAADAGLELTVEVDAGGKAAIDRDLEKYQSAGRAMPWVVFRDLDADAPCAGEFVREAGVGGSRWFRLRLAVRELESWILADAPGLSTFLRVAPKWLPERPDEEADPTRSLLAVAARAPAAMRRRLIAAPGGATAVGPLYEATLIEFGERFWDVGRASQRSPSLRRARASLRELAREWEKFVGGV